LLIILQLTVKELNDAIKGMHKDKKYKEMVFYIEACESGSMFKDVLPADINGKSTLSLS
jgi:legumain